MNSDEVVMHIVNRNCGGVVFKFFGESVRQPREPAHGHAHREVLALNVARAHVLRVRIAGDGLLFAAKALGRAIALLAFRIVPVDLHQLGVVNASSKSIPNSGEIHSVTVGGQLDTADNPGFDVLHDLRGAPGIALPQKPAHDQFGIGVDSYERPDIASVPTVRQHLRLDVLLFGVAERPNLINLDSLRCDVAKGLIHVGSTGGTEFHDQLGDGVLGSTSHPGSGSDAVAFNQGCNDLSSLLCAQPVHIDNYTTGQAQGQVENGGIC